MQIDLVKDVVSSIVGPTSSKIVDLLYAKKNVNEFLIAKKLNLTINQTRNILYKLADEGLVSFIRKKDARKGGWYTYYWTLNSGKGLEKFKNSLENNINNQKEKASLRSKARFFFCTTCNIEYEEEAALNANYICKECGEPLILKDNTEDVKMIEKDIAKLELILVQVQQELGNIAVEEQKIRTRKAKAEQKKKSKEREARKKERERLKKKEERAKARKKKGKKTSKRR